MNTHFCGYSKYEYVFMRHPGGQELGIPAHGIELLLSGSMVMCYTMKHNDSVLLAAISIKTIIGDPLPATEVNSMSLKEISLLRVTKLISLIKSLRLCQPHVR